jgi:hypothetical protein
MWSALLEAPPTLPLSGRMCVPLFESRSLGWLSAGQSAESSGLCSEAIFPGLLYVCTRDLAQSVPRITEAVMSHCEEIAAGGLRA